MEMPERSVAIGVEVVLAGDGAVDLQDAREAIFAGDAEERGGRARELDHARGADGLTARIVPVDLAEIAREA